MELQMPNINELTHLFDADILESFGNLKIQPVLPMLSKVKKLENVKFSDYIFEEKYDGERMLAVVLEDQITKYYTRTLKETTIFKYNVQLRDGFKNCIFDGEVVYLDNEGKIIPISDTGVRSALQIEYRVFDVQYLNGHSVMSMPLGKRKNLLESVLHESLHVKLSPYKICIDEPSTMLEFRRVVNDGGEGLMLKSKNEPYMSNLRRWLKLKTLHLIDFKEEYELYAYRMKRDKNFIFNILDCGYFQNGKFVHVVNVSSGMDHHKRTLLTLMCDPTTGVFRQKVIVTLHADKITANKSLRHPSLYRVRTDIENIDTSIFHKNQTI